MPKKLGFIFPKKTGFSETHQIDYDSKLQLQDLKKEASEKFDVPIQKVLLKVERDGFLVKIKMSRLYFVSRLGSLKNLIWAFFLVKECGK